MEKSLYSNILSGNRLAFVRPYTPADVTPEIGGFSDYERCNVTDTDADGDVINEEKLSEIEKTAYLRGYEAGEKAGMEAGLESGYKETASILKTASCLIEKLERLRQEMTEKSQKEILKLSIAIARKVVHSEITVNREVMAAILKAAVKKLDVKDSVRVRLNPKDAEYVSGKKHELLGAMDGVREMTIEEDLSVPQGGCVVEAGLAEVDARLEQQLDEITDGLMKGYEENERTSL